MQNAWPKQVALYTKYVTAFRHSTPRMVALGADDREMLGLLCPFAYLELQTQRVCARIRITIRRSSATQHSAQGPANSPRPRWPGLADLTRASDANSC